MKIRRLARRVATIIGYLPAVPLIVAPSMGRDGRFHVNIPESLSMALCGAHANQILGGFVLDGDTVTAMVGWPPPSICPRCDKITACATPSLEDQR
jgi:hypothetical protein